MRSPRFTRRALSWIGLVCLIGGMLFPLLSPSHLQWDDDLDCGSGVLALGHQHTAIAADQHAPPPLRTHCTICHLQRALTLTVLAEPPQLVPRWTWAELRVPPASRWQSALFAPAQPSRAPPSPIA